MQVEGTASFQGLEGPKPKTAGCIWSRAASAFPTVLCREDAGALRPQLEQRRNGCYSPSAVLCRKGDSLWRLCNPTPALLCLPPEAGPLGKAANSSGYTWCMFQVLWSGP